LFLFQLYEKRGTIRTPDGKKRYDYHLTAARAMETPLRKPNKNLCEAMKRWL
jgi:hypothetical protein